MVVHNSLPGIEATVCVDRQPLKEYKIENEKVNHSDARVAAHQGAWTVTNYIESSTGKTFTVNLAIKSTYKSSCPGLQILVYVDNHYIGGWNKSKDRHKQGWTDILEGLKINTQSSATLMPMQFTEIRSSGFNKTDTI